ncbi:NAC domain-containing protein 104-like isoform X1 [Olea europaea var. sylvestris]|uniref:NAC domain-containing protein 104-like isoform X1 n=1 Tax=Olea europaea var. sylvestris TaxID=158386 RepID=UPI000C1D198D|nr:NAC domain-containing protein 104-like isoform X1 [Olea europaea var. sylvestris]
MEEDRSTLPPGLCFAPTDEELIVYFLYQKAASLPCYPNVIPDLNLYSPHPWELDDKTFASRRQWYFFSRKMQNRTAENGFWKEIGVDETILTSTGNKVGIKKYLVFYDDDVRSENKTNWIMEEYRLLISPKGQNQIQDLDEWVLCRVHEANISSDGLNFPEGDGDGDGDELSYLDEVFLSLEDDQEEINFPY